MSRDIVDANAQRFCRLENTGTGHPPAEADLIRFFKVAPPIVHQMVVTLEQAGLISRTLVLPEPSKSSSIKLACWP
jgi:hypothetical protein